MVPKSGRRNADLKGRGKFGCLTEREALLTRGLISGLIIEEVGGRKKSRQGVDLSFSWKI